MGGTWVQQENGNWRCEGSEGEHLPSKDCWTQGNPGQDLTNMGGGKKTPIRSRRSSNGNGEGNSSSGNGLFIVIAIGAMAYVLFRK